MTRVALLTACGRGMSAAVGVVGIDEMAVSESIDPDRTDWSSESVILPATIFYVKKKARLASKKRS